MEKITRLTQLIDANYDSIKPDDFMEMHNIVKSLYKSKFASTCEDPIIVYEWIENAQNIIELLELIRDFWEDNIPEDWEDEIMDIKKQIKVITDKQKLLLNDIVIKPPQPLETVIYHNNFINTEGLKYKPIPSANRMIIKKLFR